MLYCYSFSTVEKPKDQKVGMVGCHHCLHSDYTPMKNLAYIGHINQLFSTPPLSGYVHRAMGIADDNARPLLMAMGVYEPPTAVATDDRTL